MLAGGEFSSRFSLDPWNRFFRIDRGLRLFCFGEALELSSDPFLRVAEEGHEDHLLPLDSFGKDLFILKMPLKCLSYDLLINFQETCRPLQEVSTR